MTMAATVRAALADLSAATILAAEPGCRVTDLVAEMRAARREIAILVIDSGVAALDRAMLIAAIGPLAIERAPAGRIGAVDVVAGAARDDVEAAARFLVGAGSTTGQVLVVAPEG